MEKKASKSSTVLKRTKDERMKQLAKMKASNMYKHIKLVKKCRRLKDSCIIPGSSQAPLLYIVFLGHELSTNYETVDVRFNNR